MSVAVSNTLPGKLNPLKPFPFTKVLDYRRHSRQECRQELAAVMAEEQQLLHHRADLEQQKQSQLVELGRLAASSEFSVDAAARRRYFAGQLEIEVLLVDDHVAQLQAEIERCRDALIQADKDVQALERLEVKHVSREEYERLRRSEIELSDQWQAGKLSVVSKP